MEAGLLQDFLGIFQRQVKDIIFAWRGAHQVKLNLCRVRLKQTSETQKGGGGIRLTQVW